MIKTAPEYDLDRCLILLPLEGVEGTGCSTRGETSHAHQSAVPAISHNASRAMGLRRDLHRRK